MYCDYYEQVFNNDEIEEAFSFYERWSKSNNQPMEVPTAEDVDETNIGHVMYHAEIEGYKVNN